MHSGAGAGTELGLRARFWASAAESRLFAAACPGQCWLWGFRSFSCFFGYLGWGEGLTVLVAENS